MMRRLYSIIFIGTLLLPARPAQAVSVTFTGFATQDLSANPPTVYYPMQGVAPLCASNHAYPPNLHIIDPTSQTSEIPFTIQATSSLSSICGGGTCTSASILAVMGTTPIQLFEHSNMGYNGGSSTLVNYGLGEHATISVGLKLNTNGNDSFCSNTSAGTCQPGSTGNLSQGNITIGVVSGSSASAFDNNADKATFNIVAVDCPPHDTQGLSLPKLNYVVMPGDQRVKLMNSSAPPVDPSGIRSVLVFGTTSGSQPAISNSVDPTGFQREFGNVGGGVYTIDGLQNDQTYCFGLGYVNRGGLVSTDPGWGDNIYIGNLSASQICAKPSQVDGFLNDKSTCLITSIAGGEEWEERFDILRRFRDQWLERTTIGQSFVDWYYDRSPTAMHWLSMHPRYKPLLRGLLFPLIGIAQTALWLGESFWVLVGLLIIAGLTKMGFAFQKIRRRRIA